MLLFWRFFKLATLLEIVEIYPSFSHMRFCMDFARFFEALLPTLYCYSSNACPSLDHACGPETSAGIWERTRGAENRAFYHFNFGGRFFSGNFFACAWLGYSSFLLSLTLRRAPVFDLFWSLLSEFRVLEALIHTLEECFDMIASTSTQSTSRAGFEPLLGISILDLKLVRIATLSLMALRLQNRTLRCVIF